MRCISTYISKIHNLIRTILAVVTREPEVYNGRKISDETVLLIALYYTASVLTKFTGFADSFTHRRILKTTL
jgi:hypothetical protein